MGLFKVGLIKGAIQGYVGGKGPLITIPEKGLGWDLFEVKEMTRSIYVVQKLSPGQKLRFSKSAFGRD